MKKAVLLRLLILNLACILFAAMPGMAQGFRSPQDSLSFIHDSIQRIVDSRPDSNRHGFFHAERFHSSFHVQAEGDFGYQMTKMSAVVGFQAAWVINHKISIGIKYDLLTSTVNVNKYIYSLDTISPEKNPKPNPVQARNMSALLNVGYIVRAGKKFAIEPAVGLGWTQVTFFDPKLGWFDPAQAKTENFTANYFVLNPSVSFIWNTTRNVRLGAILGAKGVLGTDYLRLKSYRVGGAYVGFFIRFGTF